MSDAHSQHDDDSPHEGPIKTPKQLVLAVFFSFVIPIIAIILLATFVTTDQRPAAGSDGLGAEATARRIMPVGRVDVKDVSDPSALKSGEQVFTAQCSACHAAGVAGAPKLGDEAAWSARLKTGYEALLTSALKGKGAMGAQGGGDHSDLEIARAVVYMSNKAGGNFPEPKAGAAATAAAPAAAGTAAAAAPAASAAPVAAEAAPAAAPATTTTVAAAAGAVPALYTTACGVCHVAGVAGAPKIGDKAAWGPRLAAGVDGLTASVIKGKGAMPPRGGSAGTDAEIKAVVAYMVAAAK